MLPRSQTRGATRRFARSLLLIAVTLLPALAEGQWTPIAKPNWNGVITPYFLNPTTGFVFGANIRRASERISIVPQTTGAYKTTNAGTTWTEMTYFKAIPVTQLSFISLNEGFASTLNSVAGIVRTTDGGESWSPVPCPPSQYSSIYASAQSVVATACGSGYPRDLVISHDHGQTWQTVTVKPTLASGTLTYTYVCGNLDHAIYAIGADSYDDIFFVYSLDDGHTWSYSSLDRRYPGSSVQLFAMPHSTQVIRQHLDAWDKQNDTYSFYSARAPYSTWTNSLQRSETGGWMSGNACAQYLPNAVDRSGMYRSMDRGVNWTIVGGPNTTEIDDGDWQTMSVVGYGAVVFAVGSMTSEFLVTTKGGDGKLSAASLAPNASCSLPSGLPIRLGACDSSRFVVTVTNTGCSIARARAISITGLPDSAYYAEYRDHLIDDGQPDSILITVAPTSDLTPRDLVVRLVDDEYVTYDKTIPLTFDRGSANEIALATNTPTLPLISGKTVDIPLYARPIGSAVSATTLSATFKLRHDLFTPVSFTPTWRGVLNHAEIFGGDSAQVDLTLDPAVLLGASTQVGYLTCATRLTDSNRATITMSNTNAVASDGSCLTAFGEDTTIATTSMDCSGRIMQDYMRGESFTIDLTMHVDRTVLSLHVNDRHQDVYHATIYSMTGEAVARGEWSGANGSINLNAVPSGSYVLLVQYESTTAGAATRGLTITR